MSYYSIDSECYTDWKNEVFKNKYILLQQLSTGSYASVWLCYAIDSKQYYAMKIPISKCYDVGCKESANFNIINDLKSDYIMKKYDSFDHVSDMGKHTCCVLELMGYSIYKVLKTNKFIDFDIVMKCVYCTLKGLVSLHEKHIIHGDVKPENILLVGRTDECNEYIKKLDLEKNIKKNTDIKNIIKKMNILNPCSDSESNESSDSSNSISEHKFETESNISVDIYADYNDDSEYDEDELDERNDNEKIILDKDNFRTKLGDFGISIFPDDKRTCEIQTTYYKSLELLLNNPYNETVDMWALGCCIYELLSGKILFDHLDEKTDCDRDHIYHIVKKLGVIPTELMESSPNRERFFNTKLTKIKGYDKINFEPLLDDFNEICKKYNLNDDVKNSFINFTMNLFHYDINKRMTSMDALNHPLMKCYSN